MELGSPGSEPALLFLRLMAHRWLPTLSPESSFSESPAVSDSPYQALFYKGQRTGMVPFV